MCKTRYSPRNTSISCNWRCGILIRPYIFPDEFKRGPLMFWTESTEAHIYTRCTLSNILRGSGVDKLHLLNSLTLLFHEEWNVQARNFAIFTRGVSAKRGSVKIKRCSFWSTPKATVRSQEQPLRVWAFLLSVQKTTPNLWSPLCFLLESEDGVSKAIVWVRWAAKSLMDISQGRFKEERLEFAYATWIFFVCP